MGFLISWIGFLSGLCTINEPEPFRKANPRARRLGGVRPTGLRALWLMDLKSWVLPISEIICFLVALEYETFSKY